MKTETKTRVVSLKSNALASEVQFLFNQAVSVRSSLGVTSSLRTGYVRNVINDGVEGETVLSPINQEECSGSCDCKAEESCSICEPELEDVCSIDDAIKHHKDSSPFKNIANLLTTVKKYEYISLVEHAYAQIGNKPFKLKPTKAPTITDKQIKKSAKIFYDYLDNFLTENKVRVTEIPDAFNLETLGDVTKSLADVAQEETKKAIQESINGNEAVLERVFKRSNFMNEYMEVLKDTTDYPIGILWIDDKSLKKERVIKDGVMTFNHVIQADVSRIDPCYFWATEDHTINHTGRAVFKLEQLTAGDLRRWMSVDISKSKIINDNISEYLDMHDDGYKMTQATLFRDHRLVNKGVYDVLVCRGTFAVEDVESMDISIPSEYDKDEYVPCEIYFSGSTILRVRVLSNVDDKLGVYTTVFRRRGSSLFGYSLHEFIYPFAELYSASIDAIDVSVGKSIGSITQVDIGVLSNPDKYLTKDPKTGEVSLDLSSDLIVEFDSTQAFNSPNFKGVPITVDQLPSDLNKLLPVVDFIFSQLDRLSGIPSILVNSSNISSALRTNSNFNAAFTASAKVVQALLRESENRILKPSIRYIFDSKASSGDMVDFLLEAEPEILLSDTLTRELNDDRDLLQGVQTLAQFSQLIPQEKLAGLINTVGREVYNLEDDLIPGVGALATTTPSSETQSV